MVNSTQIILLATLFENTNISEQYTYKKQQASKKSSMICMIFFLHCDCTFEFEFYIIGQEKKTLRGGTSTSINKSQTQK